jgi:anti-anti-sigma regulatory factor
MAEPAPRHYFEWEDAAGITVVRFTINVLREERIIRSLYAQLDQLIVAGRTRVVMNFAGVAAFASYAIGKLIVLNDKLQPPAGRLVLCELTPAIDEILDLMRLRKQFNVYGSEREALESFA